MIPLRLTLRNFMSYGPEQMVDFSDLHLACLSGENGHGKSALLDAITWALWGRARAPGDSLVRLGQSSMTVELEFEVDEARYRVIRTRYIARTSSTHTELQGIITDADSHSLTGSGEHETQAKIIRLLGMGYDVFVNSAFILQGRADEFTRQKPAERKQILAEMLDLARYDALEEKARQRQRTADDRARVLEADTETLRGMIRLRPQYESRLEEATERLNREQEARRQVEEQLDRAERERSELEKRLSQLQLLRSQEEMKRSSAAQAQQQECREREKLDRIDRILSERERIEQRVALLRERQQQLETMEAGQQRHSGLVAREHELEGELGRLRHALDLKRTRLLERREPIAKAARDSERLQKEIARLRRSHRPAAVVEIEFEALRSQSEDEKCVVQHCALELDRLSKEQQEISQRRELLAGPSAHCPVCRKALDPENHRRLLHELARDQEAREEEKLRLEAEKQRADAAALVIARAGRKVKAELEASRAAEQEIACYIQDLERAKELIAGGPALEAELLALEAELSGPLDPSLAARLAEAQAERLKLGYTPDRHLALREEVRRLEGVHQEYQGLLAAAEARVEVEHRVQELSAAVASSLEEAERLRDQARPLEQTAARRDELEALCKQLGEARRELARMEALVREDVGSARSQIEHCDRLEADVKEKDQEKATAGRDAAIYKELVTAFGKRGIQAMIIENVVPELEDEANRLLARMTDNGMHIQFNTQRELKKGGGAETLEIVIGDELGERPYECYSGGEAFRVNFAIRIALSRLLTRRAGSRLQTVVIDEGFGTQDAQGRSRLVEAIESIRDEFSLILVITHLDDLKDEFPRRLHVIKDENGSRVVPIGA